MNPLVSVIVTCYNKKPYLDATLEAVEQQTYPNVEVVLVDDGSTDGSTTILEQYAASRDKVTLIVQSNQGVSAARNVGIRASHGEYVMSLDADDLLSPQYVERCSAYLIDHPDCKLVYTKADTFGNVNGPWEIPPYHYEDLVWSNLIFVSAMYRRSDFDRTDGYRQNMRHGLEDWDFWLSFLGPHDQVHCIDEVLFHWRIAGHSRSKEAETYELDSYRQLFMNHRDIYEPYLDQLVYYKEKWSQCKTLLDQTQKLRQSKSYRIGRFIAHPLEGLRSLFSKSSPC